MSDLNGYAEVAPDNSIVTNGIGNPAFLQRARMIGAISGFNQADPNSVNNTLNALVQGGAADQAAAVQQMGIKRTQFEMGQNLLTDYLTRQRAADMAKAAAQAPQAQAQAPQAAQTASPPSLDDIGQSLQAVRGLPLAARPAAFAAAAQAHGFNPAAAIQAVGGDLSDANLDSHIGRFAQASQASQASQAASPPPVAPGQSTYAQNKDAVNQQRYQDAQDDMSPLTLTERAIIKSFDGVDLDGVTEGDRFTLAPKQAADTQRQTYLENPQTVKNDQGQDVRFDNGAAVDRASAANPASFIAPSAAQMAGLTKMAENMQTPTYVQRKDGKGSDYFASTTAAQAAAAANPGVYGEQPTFEKARDSALGAATADPATTPVQNADGSISLKNTNRADLSQAGSGGTLVMNDPQKNNNLTNIKSPGKGTWQGQVGTTPAGFAIFKDQASADRAADLNVQSYMRKGVNTPEAIASRWTNGGGGPGYTQAISAATGIPAGQQIPNTPEMRAAIIRGVKVGEGTANGGGKGVVRVGGDASGIPAMQPSTTATAVAGATASAQAQPIASAAAQNAATAKVDNDNFNTTLSNATNQGYQQQQQTDIRIGLGIKGLAAKTKTGNLGPLVAQASGLAQSFGIDTNGAAGNASQLQSLLSQNLSSSLSKGSNIRNEKEFATVAKGVGTISSLPDTLIFAGAAKAAVAQQNQALANFAASWTGPPSQKAIEAAFQKQNPGGLFAQPAWQGVKIGGADFVHDGVLNGKKYRFVGLGFGSGNYQKFPIN